MALAGDVLRTVAMQSVFNAGCDYYVDSINGNDGNTGKRKGQAFQTLAAVQAVMAAGLKIGFARGSSWREALTLDVNGVKLRSYGSGAAPVLDASDVVSTGDMSKTGGRTNVYQFDLVLDDLTTQYFNLFEDDLYLTRVTSVANCDSTPGSVYPSAEFGSITVYFHASDSSDPTASGKVYEYTNRGDCIFSAEIYGGHVIRGLHCKRGRNDHGAVSAKGSNNTFIGLTVEQGGNHTFQIGPGAVVDGCTIDGVYSGARSATCLNINADTPSGEDVTIRNCTISNTQWAERDVGLSAHRNTSGSFGTVRVENTTLSGWVTAYSLADITDFESDTMTLQNNQYNISGATYAQTHTNLIISTDVVSHRAVSQASTGAITITGLNYTGDARSSGAQFYINGAGAVTVTDATITQNVTNSGAPMVRVLTASADLTLLRNTWESSQSITLYTFDAGASGFTWESDYNEFSFNNFSMSIFGTTYSSLATYQAAVTPQDENSTAA